MTDNEKLKIVRWMGLYKGWSDADVLKTLADYISDYSTDAEAVGLLNVLVEKGYEPVLSWHRELGEWQCYTVNLEFGEWGKTIHEAIVDACLRVIEKEEGND